MQRNQLIITSLIAVAGVLFGVYELNDSNEFIIEPPSGWNYLEDPSVMKLQNGEIVVFSHGGRCCNLVDRERVFVWRISPTVNKTAFIRPLEADTHEIGFNSAVRVRGLLGLDLFHTFIVRTSMSTVGLENRVRIGHGFAGSPDGTWTWQDGIIPVVNQECQQEGTCSGIGQHHPIAFFDGTNYNVFFIEHAGGNPIYRYVKLNQNFDVVWSGEMNLDCPEIGGFCSPFSDGGIFGGSTTMVTTALAPNTWSNTIYVMSWTGLSWRKIRSYQIPRGYVKGCAFFRNESGTILDLNNFVCVYSDTKDETPNNSIYWRLAVINTNGTPIITSQPDWSGLSSGQPTPTPGPSPTPTPRPTPTPPTIVGKAHVPVLHWQYLLAGMTVHVQAGNTPCQLRGATAIGGFEHVLQPGERLSKTLEADGWAMAINCNYGIAWGFGGTQFIVQPSTYSAMVGCESQAHFRSLSPRRVLGR